MNTAWIGTGYMGEPMAMRLLLAGHRLKVFNRTAAKTVALAEAGASVAASAVEAVTDSELVFLMLTDAAAIRELLLSEPAASQLNGKTVFQMATIAPDESRALMADINALGGQYLEAPVLGSIPEARQGSLILMVGCSEQQFGDYLELLKCFGPNPVRIGEVGQASAIKLAYNQLIASLTAAFSLSLQFAQAQGIDEELFMRLLRDSALYAPTFDKKLARMLQHEYGEPNFPTRHLAKDIALFLDASRDMGLDTSSLAAVADIVNRAMERGFADGDYSALFEGVSTTA